MSLTRHADDSRQLGGGGEREPWSLQLGAVKKVFCVQTCHPHTVAAKISNNTLNHGLRQALYNPRSARVFGGISPGLRER
jgi:hypothetical protein